MTEDDTIKRDVESPLTADDHAPYLSTIASKNDDIDDDFGRDIKQGEAQATHASPDGDDVLPKQFVPATYKSVQ